MDLITERFQEIGSVLGMSPAEWTLILIAWMLVSCAVVGLASLFFRGREPN